MAHRHHAPFLLFQQLVLLLVQGNQFQLFTVAPADVSVDDVIQYNAQQHSQQGQSGDTEKRLPAHGKHILHLFGTLFGGCLLEIMHQTREVPVQVLVAEA